MRNFLNQQLKGKDVQLATLAKDLEMTIDWQKRVEVAEEVTKRIQIELKTRTTKYDKLVNKYVQIEKEGVQVKKSVKSKMISDKKMILLV